MDWKEVAQTIILSAITSSSVAIVLVSALGWLGRKIAERWFLKNLEKYKAKLQMENAKELERLRTDLGLESLKQQIQFSTLHSKRAEVIEELYKRIVAAEKDFYSLTSIVEFEGEPSREEKAQQAHKSGLALQTYMNDYRIYFGKELGESFNKYSEGLFEVFAKFQLSSQEPVGSDLKYKNWTESYKQLADHVSSIKQRIEDDFRKLIGVVS